MNTDEAVRMRRERSRSLWAAYNHNAQRLGYCGASRVEFYTHQCDLLKARIELLEAVNTDEPR